MRINLLSIGKIKIILGILVAGIIIMFVSLPFESPLSVVCGATKLWLSDSEIEKYKVDNSFEYFITEAKTDELIMLAIVQEDNWKFKEQIGAGYIFVDPNDENISMIVAEQKFTNRFILWKVPRKTID